MRRALSRAAVLACLLLPASAVAQTKIQPGASMEICTLNFIYDGLGANAGKVYIGTAAHCVERVGDVVNDGDGEPIGKVAFLDDADLAAADYAFVELLPSVLGRVDPSMKGYPEYPTGFTVPEDTAAGDLVQISGYGMVFGDLGATTQERRQGILQTDDEETYTFSGPSVNGDSGGPLVHVDSGKALGIVSRYGFETASTDYGPTMQGLLTKAAARDFPVRLRLAGETGPPAPAPAPPAGPPAPAPPPAQPQPQPESQSQPAAAAPAKRSSSARKRKALKRCRKAAKKIKRPAKRRAALRRCARAARR